VERESQWDTARKLAAAIAVAAAVVIAVSPWTGGADARTHALVALGAAALAALVARAWASPQIPPERLARVFLVGSLLLAGATQLLQAFGALGPDVLTDVGEALARIAYALVLMAVVAAIGVAFAKSQRQSR
jgi:drug/metabolite transporter (DMT)-like permease